MAAMCRNEMYTNDCCWAPYLLIRSFSAHPDTILIRHNLTTNYSYGGAVAGH